MTRLADRIALITQATQFAGPAVARRLVAAGARVACFDEAFADPAAARDFAALAASGDDDAGDARGVIATFPAADPEAMAAKAEGELGPLDIAISNDAHPAVRMPLDAYDAEVVRAALDALVAAPYALAAAAAARMIARGRNARDGTASGGTARGRIIFMTSAAPLRGLGNYGAYAAGRGGANALALSLARELARHGITVNAVAPNFIRTPAYFPDSLMADPKSRDKILSNIPLGRLGAPEEVAGLVAYLASDEGGFVTGRVIPIDGGWS